VNKAIKLAPILILALLAGCGHRPHPAPSGGPEDTEAPVVLDITPAPLDTLNSRITIVFSKPIERTSALTAVRIYPPILDRKLRWPDQQTMVIDIREALDDNTNYTLWLGADIKDTHGNALAEPQAYVFRHGALQQGRISGTFSWDDPALSSLPVRVDLFSADTTFIASQTCTGGAFEWDNLNIAPYLVRALADVGGDGRYTYGEDPRGEATTTGNEREALTLTLAVEDTVAAHLTKAAMANERQLTLTFSEPVVSFDSLSVFTADSLALRRPVTRTVLRSDALHLLLPPLAEGKYLLHLWGSADARGNRTPADSIFFDAAAVADTVAPVVLFTQPRSGAVLGQVKPLIEVRFSEIIPAESARFELVRDETSTAVPIIIERAGGDHYVLRPTVPLQTYSTYRLEVSASDAAGNPLAGEHSFRWIAIIK